MKTLLATLLSCLLIFCAGLPFFGQQAGSLPGGGGGGAPGGLDTQVQFNNAGTLAGTANLTIVGGIPTATNGLIIGNNHSVSVSGGASITFGNDVLVSTFGGSFLRSNNALTLLETAPGGSGIASYDTLFGNSSTHTLDYNINNGGVAGFSGAWVCTNVTPVTVTANVATDQTLMACTIPAGTINRVGRSLRILTSTIYSTPAASTTAMTIKVKICSVSGCGSGNVLTAATITSSALGTIQVTNNAIQLPLYLTVQTAGAALAVEAHGCMNIDLVTSISGADTVFCDNNTTTQTGTPSAIDSTAQNFLQVTGAFTVASASNSWSQRQMVAETIN